MGPKEKTDHWEGIAFEQAKPERHVLELWLTHTCQTDVAAMEVDEGCFLEPAPPLRRRWLAYGDSITQGMVASLPTRTAVARCALALNAEVRNLALGGAVLDEWLADTVPDGQFDVVSIAYGTNDFNRAIPVATYQANARRLLSALTAQKPKCPVVLITLLTWVSTRRPGVKGGQTIAAYRESLRALAAEFSQVRLVHGDALLPDAEEWFVDGVHPNDRGFELYAEHLLPHLRVAVGR